MTSLDINDGSYDKGWDGWFQAVSFACSGGMLDSGAQSEASMVRSSNWENPSWMCNHHFRNKGKQRFRNNLFAPVKNLADSPQNAKPLRYGARSTIYSQRRQENIPFQKAPVDPSSRMPEWNSSLSPRQRRKSREGTRFSGAILSMPTWLLCAIMLERQGKLIAQSVLQKPLN
jgi:hypothetical protein